MVGVVRCYILLFVLSCFLAVPALDAAKTAGAQCCKQPPQLKKYEIGNGKITCTVSVLDGKLVSEVLEAKPGWLPGGKKYRHKIKTDGNFGIDVQWTDWQAPGKVQNADNPVVLTSKHFKMTDATPPVQGSGTQMMILVFKSPDHSLEARLTYKLEKGDFFIKRRLDVRDTKKGNHFLRWLWPRRGVLYGDVTIVKPGGFGRPLAVRTKRHGAFFGLEYPAAENFLKAFHPGKTKIATGQEMGMKMSGDWVSSEWTVSALVPDTHVKLWFKRYLKTVRVAQLKPYLLYNTWYDVRAPEYTERPEDVMNEKHLLRIVNDFKREMVDKRGLKLDAFVLDDAWDIYKSDWVLRKKEFPGGLKPVKEALDKMDCKLGIWFGPTGGYSHRAWRIEWMKAHGYEVVGDQLCLAGKNYHKLFKKRVTDFVNNDGVMYFKWDGIQFSCSQPDHGHPVGIYSRRAVMEAVVDLCKAVRKDKPRMYLNITSGTWLSPWWVKYANMIWMQGYDYGYANVPSISKRDAAITYRDVVLHDNYKVHDFWFPISNLMTHGIIKGHLQKLGGEAEPLDKFTDNAILYFARGVSMWELYISPNLLTDGEWDAIARSIRWAKDRFDILKQTEMIGGDPEKREPYGYVHFKGKKGIVAARNPFIEGKTLNVKLDTAMGLCWNASSLVVERVYPNRWISPRLVSAGAIVKIPLKGYETAIYEIYPLDEAQEPLVADVVFDAAEEKGHTYSLDVREIGKHARLLNPGTVKEIKVNGKPVQLHELVLSATGKTELVEAVTAVQKNNRMDVSFNLKEPVETATLCFLAEPGFFTKKNEKKKRKQLKKPLFKVSVYLNNKRMIPKIQEQEGKWAWYKVTLDGKKAGVRQTAKITWKSIKKKNKWKGKITPYLITVKKAKSKRITLTTTSPLKPRRPIPPSTIEKTITKLSK